MWLGLTGTRLASKFDFLHIYYMLNYGRVSLYDSVINLATDATALLFKGLAESEPSIASNDTMKCLQVCPLSST